MDSWLSLGVVVALFVGVALVPYLLLERKWRWRWQEVEIGRDPAHAHEVGLFRAPGTVPRYLREAPPLVRVAALSCLLFGQMFIPGLAMGLIGFVVGGIGVVSVPGLITAWKLYGTGLALLRRDPLVAWRKARSAVQWSLWLNGMIMGAALCVLPIGIYQHSGPLIVLSALFDIYGVFSIAQALVLRAAVKTYEDALLTPSQA